MKIVKLTIVLISIIVLVSCGDSIDEQSANAKGFSAIEKELKSKFGESAYFTNINILYDTSYGNVISVTVTEDPASLKMGEWNRARGDWNQTSEITLEIPEGTQAKDFMFQLNEQINLSKLGELVETSSKKLMEEKDIDRPILEMAFIKFPKNGDITKTEYIVKLEPENGGTSFTFLYALNGDFIKMDY